MQIVGVKHQDFHTCLQTPFCRLYRSALAASGEPAGPVDDKEDNPCADAQLGFLEPVAPLPASSSSSSPLETTSSKAPLVWSLRPGQLLAGARRYEAVVSESLTRAEYTLAWSVSRHGQASLNVSDAQPSRLKRYVWPLPFVSDMELVLARAASGLYDEIRWQEYKVRFYYEPFELHVLRGERRVFQFNGNQRLRMETAEEDAALRSGSLAFDVDWPGAEQVYGIPEHATRLALPATLSPLAYLSDPYRLYNLDVFEYELNSTMALYGAIPVMLSHSIDPSVGTLALLWPNPSEMWIDVRHDAPSPGGSPKKIWTHWMSEAGSLDLVLFFGPSPAQVLDQYTMLTGRLPMPPLFGIAYHQCRWNYENTSDVLQVDAGFDAHQIPMDVIWLDIEHTDGKRYMTWDSDKFGDPIAMQQALAKKSRKMVTIVDPHIKVDKQYHIYSEALARDFFVKNAQHAVFEGHCWPGNSAWIDFLNPAARGWWASKIALCEYKGSTQTLYIWNDMNEPSVFGGPEVTMPKDAVHHGGWSHRDVHNIYGMHQQMATFRGLEQRNRARAFVLSRAFFAGSQKYGAIWTGDNRADWGHLAISLPMLLTIGMAGLAFAGADVGGFFGNPDPELLVRWYQAAVFTPFFRAHSHIDTLRREPWLFGDQVTALIREAICTRYMLLPYWYTLFFESSISGRPMMRPMFFEHPEDASSVAMDDQFYLGSGLLIHPVTAPSVQSVSVYLPGLQEGVVWYDFFTREQIGSQTSTFLYAVGPGTMPLFLRGGSVVPLKTRRRLASELMHNDPWTLLLALDRHDRASGALYLDDESTLAHQSGQYQYRSVAAAVADGSLVLSSRLIQGTGAYRHAMDGLPFAKDPLSCKVERIVVLGVRASIQGAMSISEDGQALAPCQFSQASDGVLTVKLPCVSIDKDWSISFSLAE